MDREFGTGALKITPGHDVNDFAIGQRHSLPVVNVMNKDGTMNEVVRIYICYKSYLSAYVCLLLTYHYSSLLTGW